MFFSYTNTDLQPQQQMLGGIQTGYRIPEFDINVVPQKRSAYTKMNNNELALQFYNLGFFNPQLADQALACLTMMDFDSIEDVRKTIKQNGTLYESYSTLMQIAALLAAKYGDAQAMAQIQALAQRSGAQIPQAQTGGDISLESNSQERAMVTNAREQTRAAAMPEGNAAND